MNALVFKLLAIMTVAVVEVQNVSWMKLKPSHNLKFSNSNEEFELNNLWNSFKQEFEKSYESESTDGVRKLIFQSNLKYIKEHNDHFENGHKSYNLAINQFTDMTTEEVAKMMNGFRPELKKYKGSTFLSANNIGEIPNSVDWRKVPGYVSNVKNQGKCGSCWAFSTTGALEGQHFRISGRFANLSEQNLVDCSVSYGNNGCGGGLMDNAFQYVKDNKGVDTEDAYPYEARERGECSFKPSAVGATDSGFVDIPQGDEEKLKEAIATIGPVSVAIDANHPSFMSYRSGVFDEPLCNSENLDHGVLAVGYGVTDDGREYWIVKNSWSERWGDNGYIYMARNKHNQCGIASMASYPLV